MDYTYEELCNDLKTGREIEFVYGGRMFFIGYGEGKNRQFGEMQIGQYQDFPTADEVLLNAMIDGKRLAEIWDYCVIEAIY